MVGVVSESDVTYSLSQSDKFDGFLLPLFDCVLSVRTIRVSSSTTSHLTPSTILCNFYFLNLSKCFFFRCSKWVVVNSCFFFFYSEWQISYDFAVLCLHWITLHKKSQQQNKINIVDGYFFFLWHLPMALSSSALHCKSVHMWTAHQLLGKCCRIRCSQKKNKIIDDYYYLLWSYDWVE